MRNLIQGRVQVRFPFFGDLLPYSENAELLNEMLSKVKGSVHLLPYGIRAITRQLFEWEYLLHKY